MRQIAALALALLACAASCFASSTEMKKPEHDCRARPAWCQPGYVCLPTPCAAESAAELMLLTSEVEAMKKKGKASRFHLLGMTCGPAASLSVDAGDTTFAGTVSCAVGFTFTSR